MCNLKRLKVVLAEIRHNLNNHREKASKVMQIMKAKQFQAISVKLV